MRVNLAAHAMCSEFTVLISSKANPVVCSLKHLVFWELLGFMGFTVLTEKIQFALCTDVLSRGFRQMLFPTVVTYSVLYIQMRRREKISE